MDRNLYDYLPPFLHSVQELMTLMRAEQPEVENLWKATDDVLNERYVTSASEYGVKRWEHILQITPKVSETLPERKARIKSRIGLILPYTLPWLKTSLAAQFGADRYSTYLEKYTLYLAVDPQDEDTAATLDNFLLSLQEIRPVNIIFRMAFRFNRGLKLSKVFSQYITTAALCGQVLCGVLPHISTLGESYASAATTAAIFNSFPVNSAACGDIYCGQQ